MNTIKYKVIKSEEQYDEYCRVLEELVFEENTKENQEEIELLTLLIEDWEEEHRVNSEIDPVGLVVSLMKDHSLNQTELAKIAGVGKSYISEILNYKKRMSKKVIRNIANHFSIRQKALNKSYKLDGEKGKEISDSTKDLKGEEHAEGFLKLVRPGKMVRYQEDEEVHSGKENELMYSIAN